MHSRCTCGCGTSSFTLDRDAVAPAATPPGLTIASAMSLVTETGECPGEVLLFVHTGYISSLEVCSWSDDIDVTMQSARAWLRP
jgi:hypothetical protein